MIESPVTILLVDDDWGHARLVEKNLRRACSFRDIIHQDRGDDALRLLFGATPDSVPTRPKQLLVILDINMPGLSGIDVLRRIRQNPDTRHIPVIMLTTTDDRQEINRCYQEGCSVYLTKPTDYGEFGKTINDLALFISRMAIPQ